MGEVEVPWSQYDKAYKRIHDKIADLVNSTLTAVKPGKKINKYTFTWDANGNLSTLKGQDNDELLFTLTFTWNPNGTLQEISRS